MQEILMLDPIFVSRLWGGERIKEHFGYQIQDSNIGECWAISAHKNGDCKIKNGLLKGNTLSSVYSEHRELFGNSEDPVFPLLTKIIDASDDLSIQVHPDDEFAEEVENDLGKTECWYIIDCNDDARIVYGHNAATRDELNQMLDNGEWESLMNTIPIKPGDFFYVPAGTVHAICKGTLILETQQSSDTTYRIYDYDRVDENGIKRQLHFDKAKSVISVDKTEKSPNPTTYVQENCVRTVYVASEFFTVEKWIIDGPFNMESSNYKLFSVLNGTGTINGSEISKGDHFILTSAASSIELDGNLELIVSFV